MINIYSEYEVDGIVLCPTLFSPSPAEHLSLPIKIINNQLSPEDFQTQFDDPFHSVRSKLDGGSMRIASFHIFYDIQGCDKARCWAQWHLGIDWFGAAFALKVWSDTRTAYGYTDIDADIDEIALYAATGKSIEIGC